jgi:hypothetical protein
MKTPPHKSDLLARVELAMQLRDFHHKGIWEEQKHFTWLISILLSGAVVALSTGSFDESERSWLLLIIGAVGLVVTYVAVRIQSIEGESFNGAHQTFKTEFTRVFPDHEWPPPRPPKARGVKRLVQPPAGVRDHFRLLFWVFGVGFLSMLLYALHGLAVHRHSPDTLLVPDRTASVAACRAPADSCSDPAPRDGD